MESDILKNINSTHRPTIVPIKAVNFLLEYVVEKNWDRKIETQYICFAYRPRVFLRQPEQGLRKIFLTYLTQDICSDWLYIKPTTFR